MIWSISYSSVDKIIQYWDREVTQKLRTLGCSCRESRFNFQHPHGHLQPPVTTFPRDLMPFSDLLWHTHTYLQNLYVKSLNLKNYFLKTQYHVSDSVWAPGMYWAMAKVSGLSLSSPLSGVQMSVHLQTLSRVLWHLSVLVARQPSCRSCNSGDPFTSEQALPAGVLFQSGPLLGPDCSAGLFLGPDLNL